jgi:DNA-binding protein HU-beta
MKTLRKLTLKKIIMNKTELIDAIAKDAEISKVAAKKAVESFLSSIETTLTKGLFHR